MKRTRNTSGGRAAGILMLPLAALVGIACTDTQGVSGGAKTIYMNAIEYKGSATTEKEPLPTKSLPSGGGYGLTDLKTTPATWQVNAYAWAPETITVVEGDKVTLNVVGINGGSGHTASIEGHVEKFVVKRGELTTVEFTAGKPGIYKIICATHAPSMVGHMVVLPGN